MIFSRSCGRKLPIADIMKRGHDEALVKRIQHMLYIAEYKRRQAAPGFKITRRILAATALSHHQCFSRQTVNDNPPLPLATGRIHIGNARTAI